MLRKTNFRSVKTSHAPSHSSSKICSDISICIEAHIGCTITSVI